MTVTFNLSMPSDLVKLVDKQARSELRTRSEFFRALARAYLLREQKWKEIQRYGQSRAKALGIRREEDVQRIINEYRQEQRQSGSPRKHR